MYSLCLHKVVIKTILVYQVMRSVTVKQSLCLYPSGLIVLQLTFCFVEHHIIALRCHYWQHVIKSGKSNLRVAMKYMK